MYVRGSGVENVTSLYLLLHTLLTPEALVSKNPTTQRAQPPVSGVRCCCKHPQKAEVYENDMILCLWAGETQHVWPGTAVWIYKVTAVALSTPQQQEPRVGSCPGWAQPWSGCWYLQLPGKDGVLPDGVDPQPLIRILVCHLPSLDVPQHPPVHIVAPHLPWAGWGKNLIKEMKLVIPACCT